MNPKALPYLLLAPATLFLCVFFLYPFLQIAFLAFTTEGGFTTKHFQTMASNWKFWPTFWNTILLAAIVVSTCDPGATVIVTPSDHGVGDGEEFRAGVRAAADRRGECDCLDAAVDLRVESSARPLCRPLLPDSHPSFSAKCQSPSARCRRSISAKRAPMEQAAASSGWRAPVLPAWSACASSGSRSTPRSTWRTARAW